MAIYWKSIGPFFPAEAISRSTEHLKQDTGAAFYVFLIKALVQSSQADFWSHYCHVMCITSSVPYSELFIYQKAVIHMNEIESLVSYETFISKQQAYPVIINKDARQFHLQHPWSNISTFCKPSFSLLLLPFCNKSGQHSVPPTSTLTLRLINIMM